MNNSNLLTDRVCERPWAGGMGGETREKSEERREKREERREKREERRNPQPRKKREENRLRREKREESREIGSGRDGLMQRWK